MLYASIHALFLVGTKSSDLERFLHQRCLTLFQRYILENNESQTIFSFWNNSHCIVYHRLSYRRDPFSGLLLCHPQKRFSFHSHFILHKILYQQRLLMNFKIYLLFLVISPVIIFGDELMLVQTVFRHGDRTPTGTYPTDPYQEDSWPFSWGQLTTVRFN